MPLPSPRLIGMVHLGPLPGTPGAGPLADTLAQAVADARVLGGAGFDGVFVENFGDAPFHPDQVPPVTVAAMTAAALALRSALPAAVELGINVLRNDARAALAVAAASGASMIRVNVHCGARVTDQGVIQGRAWETIRLREEWAPSVAVCADVAVKHSAPLGEERPIADETADVVQRGRADAVIVTGAGTGKVVDEARLAAVKAAAGGTPVWVGSGVTAASVAGLLRVADGVIVGTALKEGGATTARVDPARAQAFVEAAKRR